MAFQLRQTLGLDTSQYDTALKRVRMETDSAFGAMGQKIGQSTQGWRRFSGAISGTVGSVRALTGVAGLAGGSIIAAASAIDKMRTASERSREAAVAEHRERKAMLTTISRTVGELSRMATMGARTGEAGSIRDAGSRVQGELSREASESWSRELEAVHALGQLRANMRKRPWVERFIFQGIGGQTTPEAEEERLERAIRFEQELQTRLRGQAPQASREERMGVRRALFAARGDAESRRVSGVAELMRLGGRPEDAAMALERDRFERQMFELDERRRAGDEFAEAEMASARMVHEARMASFAREKQTRIGNEKDVALRERREAEQSRTARMRTIADTRMDSAMDRARALGDERGLERLTEQRDRVRRMRSIMDANLPEAERNRALRELQRSARISDFMKMFGLGGGSENGTAGGLTQGVSATASAFVRRQVFGSGGAPTVASSQQQTASAAVQIAGVVNKILGVLNRQRDGVGVIG